MKKSFDSVQKELRALRATYHRVFTSPDGQKVMDDLDRFFNGDTLITQEGRLDPNATIAAAGSRKVLLYIRQMRTDHAVD